MVRYAGFSTPVSHQGSGRSRRRPARHLGHRRGSGAGQPGAGGRRRCRGRRRPSARLRGRAASDPGRLGDHSALPGLAARLVHQDQRALRLPRSGGGQDPAGLPVVPGDLGQGDGDDPRRAGRPRLRHDRLRQRVPRHVPAAAHHPQPAAGQPAGHRELVRVPVQGAAGLDGGRRHRRVRGRHGAVRPAAEPHPQAGRRRVRPRQRPVHDGERRQGRRPAAAQAGHRQGRPVRRLLRHLLRPGVHRAVRQHAAVGDAGRCVPGQRDRSLVPGDDHHGAAGVQARLPAQRRLSHRGPGLVVGEDRPAGRLPARSPGRRPDAERLRPGDHPAGRRRRAGRAGQQRGHGQHRVPRA